MSLTFMEKLHLKRLQKRIKRYEEMTKRLKTWMKNDKKEIKKLLIKDVDRIISEHTQPSAQIEICPNCCQIKEQNKKCTNCKR